MRAKKYLILFILAVFVLIASAALYCYSLIMSSGATDLGMDIAEYNVTKIYTDNSSIRVVGTQNGEVFAINLDGELLFNIGTPYEMAIYDIKVHDDDVFVVYANGNVLRFSMQQAAEFEGDGRGFFDSCRVYSTGYTFNSNGNVKNTQLFIHPQGEYMLLSGVFNDINRINRIYQFQLEDGAMQQLIATSNPMGGIGLDENGVCYYSSRSNVYYIDESGVPMQIADINETITSLSVTDDYIAVISENDKIYKMAKDGSGVVSKSLGLDLDTSYVFSTGGNFVAKIKNGGVAIIDGQSASVQFTMSAKNSANIVMWTDDSFVLRDESDISNPVIIFYSVSLARQISQFSALKTIFLAVSLLALVAVVYTGFCLKPQYRKKINAKIRAFFVAIWRDKRFYGLLAIPFTLLLVFYYIPMVLGFGLSFYDYLPGERMVFVGFTNITAVLNNPEFWSSSVTMLVFLLADILKALIPPIILAEAIIAVKLKKFSVITRILLFLPGILPGVAMTLVWSEGIFGANTNSLVNAFVGIFVPGFAKNWVNSAANSTAILTLITFGFPWIGSYLIFFGAISGISSSIFEAAEIEGCGWIKRIVKLDLPLILPQIKYIFITSFIASVQNYTNIYVLYGSDGQIKTPALLMYRDIMNAKYGIASVMGIIIFLFLSVATALNFKMQSDKT